jgi:lysophospholipase L1-like esterase
MVVHRLSRLALVPVAPVVFVQARRLRRTTPLLPDAALPWSGSVAGADPIRLLVLGDSTAAGVGADTQADALPGSLAAELSTRLGRGVRWRAVGENGATTRDLVQRFMAEAVAEPFDLVFLTIGANDALGIRSRRAFVRDLRTIVAELRRAQPESLLLMSSLPHFARFELLPLPLRWNLATHADNLELGARAVIAATPDAWLSPKPPAYGDDFFATDLFHPGPVGYRDWARFALDEAPDLLRRLRSAT